MRRIMYLSRASSTMTAEKAAAIAEKSRRKNESLGITGVLALEDGVFLQILEGPDMAVAQRFDAIRGDFRHQAFITLSDGPVALLSGPADANCGTGRVATRCAGGAAVAL